MLFKKKINYIYAIRYPVIEVNYKVVLYQLAQKYKKNSKILK